MWKVKGEHLKPYQKYLEELTKTCDKIKYTIIPRAQNQFADSLATLASMVEIPMGISTCPLEIEQKYQVRHKEDEDLVILAIEEEEIPWNYNILKFLELGIYPKQANKKERHSMRMIAIQYILCRGQPYRRSYEVYTFDA